MIRTNIENKRRTSKRPHFVCKPKNDSVQGHERTFGPKAHLTRTRRELTSHRRF